MKLWRKAGILLSDRRSFSWNPSTIAGEWISGWENHESCRVY